MDVVVDVAGAEQEKALEVFGQLGGQGAQQRAMTFLPAQPTSQGGNQQAPTEKGQPFAKLVELPRRA